MSIPQHCGRGIFLAITRVAEELVAAVAAKEASLRIANVFKKVCKDAKTELRDAVQRSAM